ncbi:MAG TPA: polysaccharide biosynthesis/export family protein [Thermoguttaceae bacterium]|nr:polysaccharide biosynthesis/export family protein [Thermoguttaceae bacterium]
MGRLIATLPPKVRSLRSCLQTAGLAVAVVLGTAGCATRVYQATELPVEFLAPATQNVQEIDLSRLPNYAVNSQLIDCGDVLEVTIVTNYASLSTTTTPVRVGENGVANIPLIGPVELARLELEGAEQAIAAAAIARGLFQRPHITVTMKRQRTNKVTVVGAVNEPNEYELPRGSSSLFAALVAAGGLSEDAGADVEIRRPVRGSVPGSLEPPGQTLADGSAGYQSVEPHPPYGAQVRRVNLAQAVSGGEDGAHLGDGDVVNVMKRAPKPIYVIGLVRQPGEVEMPANQDMYMLDALAKAGDRSMQVADKVYVIRRVPGQSQPVVIQSSVRRAKVDGAANVRLAPGDIVSVEETPATVVLEALKSFLRFGFSSAVPMF